MNYLKDPNAFNVRLILENNDNEKWVKKLKFQGEIDLGEFIGEIEHDNPFINFNEMKGIAYSIIFDRVNEVFLIRKPF